MNTPTHRACHGGILMPRYVCKSEDFQEQSNLREEFFTRPEAHAIDGKADDSRFSSHGCEARW